MWMRAALAFSMERGICWGGNKCLGFGDFFFAVDMLEEPFQCSVIDAGAQSISEYF